MFFVLDAEREGFDPPPEPRSSTVFKTAATEGRSPKVDEDWGKASIFINLAHRRYLKTVGIGSRSVAFPFTP